MDNVVDGWKGDEESVRQMVELGKVSASDFAWAKAVQQGIPFVELTEHPVDRVAVSLVPAAICRRHEVLPIAVNGSCLTLAVVDPRNVFALDDVRAAVRMQVTVVVAERKDLLGAIDRYHRVDGELSSLTTDFEEESTSQTEELNLSDSEPGQDDAPIVRFVNLLISQAIQDRASDIHIESAQYDVAVRYRIDGVLHEMQRAPKAVQNGVISRLKIMSDIDIAERRKPQDGRLSVKHGDHQIDLRVATLPTVWGESIVMRILDNTNTTLSLTDQHDIRVGTQDGSQRRRERETCLRVNLHLVDASDAVFHRVFDGDHLHLWLGDRVQGCVQCCRLSRAGRSGHQNHPVGLRERATEDAEVVVELSLIHI